jgi:hypothetical protein
MAGEQHDFKIRLEEVLRSIFCPAVGCWFVHGCHYEYYYSSDSQSYVLEVWPLAVADQCDPWSDEGSQHQLMYELAEFDFMTLVREVPLKYFHFSQRQSIFEIGWNEDGHALELKVHIVPGEFGPEGFHDT